MKKVILGGTILLFTSLLPSYSYGDSNNDFRKILASYLKADQLSDNDIAQVIFNSPQELAIAPKSSSAEEFIITIDKLGQSIQPEKLYSSSLKQKDEVLEEEELFSRLREEPLTIVIFPGIFGEFIHTHAFEEIFKNKNSAASIEFEQKIKQLQNNSCVDAYSDTCDYNYALDKMKAGDPLVPVVARSLDQYIKVASVDDDKGLPLFKVLIFDAEAMSLETLGTIRENSERFTRRLEKFFKIMGVPKNMAFLGYSRGTMTALDTLALNYSQHKSWIQNVKAMISLGGVNYGTALADDAFNPKSENGKLLEQVLFVLDNLEPIDDATLQKLGKSTFPMQTIERGKRMINNLWLLTTIKGKKPASAKDLLATLEGIRQNAMGTDIKSQLNLMIEVISNFGVTSNGGSLIDFFTLEHRRIDTLFRSIIAAVREMQTSERLNWWRKNEVPLHVKYYAVAGTMGEGLTNNRMGFNPDSVDDRMLLGNYTDYRNASGGVLVNDSQVAIQRVKFWPELSAMLNPKNSGMNSEFLGVMGTHHWGLALEIVNANKNGSLNPFPRMALLKALATKISFDLATEDTK